MQMRVFVVVSLFCPYMYMLIYNENKTNMRDTMQNNPILRAGIKDILR